MSMNSYFDEFDKIIDNMNDDEFETLLLKSGLKKSNSIGFEKEYKYKAFLGSIPQNSNNDLFKIDKKAKICFEGEVYNSNISCSDTLNICGMFEKCNTFQLEEVGA